jgi:cell wall assembly regulator SMI1
MDEIWTRLETFLQQNAPQIYDGLAPGATEAEIAETEARIGFPFPPDVWQSYRRHNGQASDSPMFMPDYFWFLSLSEVVDEWENNIANLEHLKGEVPDGDDKSPCIKPLSLNRAWVPFAWNIGGNQLCLDFDPTPVGEIGQIVEYDHAAERQRCLGPSFRIWMETIISELETGRLVWNEELQGYEYPELEEEGARA